MTREEKEQTGKYVLQMARLLEDGCYQQEMLLKAVHIIDEALEQEPMEKFKSVKDHIFKLAGDYKCWDNRLTDDEALELCHILEQEPRKRTMQLVIDNKKQKEFAHEIIKKFSFEELALFMYENSCEYCQKQHNCMGNVTPQDCAKNIRQKFEKSYFETGDEVEE